MKKPCRKTDAEQKRAPCKDCGKDTEPMRVGEPVYDQWDMYIVRDEVWAEAGMVGWGAGYLCTPCLSKRLGRRLMNPDYLCRPVGMNVDVKTDKLELVFEYHPDYLNHPSVKRPVDIFAAHPEEETTNE